MLRADLIQYSTFCLWSLEKRFYLNGTCRRVAQGMNRTSSGSRSALPTSNASWLLTWGKTATTHILFTLFSSQAIQDCSLYQGNSVAETMLIKPQLLHQLRNSLPLHLREVLPPKTSLHLPLRPLDRIPILISCVANAISQSSSLRIYGV